MTRTEFVPLEFIDDTDRIRPVDPAWAEVMADDLSRGVELPPVVIRPAIPPEVREGARFALVIGGHRIEAHRLAGRPLIRADIVPMSRAEARIREVDENLKRHELNALDRCLMLLERKRAWVEVYPETKHGGDGKHKESLRNSKSQSLRLDQPGRFSSEAADRVGLSERSVQADIELAARIEPVAIPEIRRSGLVDNASELRRLASYPAADQVAIARDIAAGNARTVEQARVSLRMVAAVVLDPQEQIFAKVVDLLSRGTAKTQRRLAEHLALKLNADFVPRSALGGGGGVTESQAGPTPLEQAIARARGV